MDDPFLAYATAQLIALVEDQERLFEVIQKEKAELVRMDSFRPDPPTGR
jgi:hypothetical protein